MTAGSEWHKWDLHVHSPASKGYGGTWEQFEEQLKNAECDVIGINDYFSVAGYKKIKARIDDGSLKLGSKKILPIVEFRMTDTVQNKNTTTNGAVHFNFHIIFNDSVKTDDIESWIRSLSCDGAIIGSDYDDSEKLSDKKVPLGDTLDSLNNDKKFSGNFLLWVPYDEYGGIDEIDPNSDKWIKEGYIRKAHLLGSANQRQRDFFLWRSPTKKDGTLKFTQEDFKTWFIRKKPCIKGSDSHKHTHPIGELMDRQSNPIEKYCWIKSDPTFEGLKQVVFEPEARIYIGKDSPKQPINTIDTIKLSIPNDAKADQESFCFAGFNKELRLNPYYNCFIGGRGSGKSTILNFLGVHSENPDASNEFWKALNPSFNFANSSIFTYSGTDIFEFLGQSEIEKFARNKNDFTVAIYNRANALAGDKLGSFEDNTKVIQTELDSIIEAQKDIVRLEAQKTSKNKDKKTFENGVKILESDEYESHRKSILGKLIKLRKYSNGKEEVKRLRDGLSYLLEDQAVLENETRDKKNPSKYEDNYNKATTLLGRAYRLLEESQFVDDEKKAKEIESDIKKIEATMKKLIEKAGYSSENAEQIKSAPQKIETTKNEITEIDKTIAQKKKLVDALAEKVKTARENKSEYEKTVNTLIEPLQKTLSEQFEHNNGKDIKKITLEYNFDDNSAWAEIANELYEVFKKWTVGEKGQNVKDFILENKPLFLKGNREDILAKLNSQKTKQNYIQFLINIFGEDGYFTIYKAIRAKHLFDARTHKIIQVKYDDRDIEQASFGQRCTSVIVILLLFGNTPLIIDEPEAHLDSSLIANYLVPLIKEKKNDRQIIFATHNANFVINGDAEKIFILKNDTGRTEIIETTIENLDNRKELLNLEGGKEAFETRGEKLGI